MPTTINVKTLRRELGSIIQRIGNGEDFIVLHRSRPAFRIVPVHGAVEAGEFEADSLYEAGPVGSSTDGLFSQDHDRILYGKPAP